MRRALSLLCAIGLGLVVGHRMARVANTASAGGVQGEADAECTLENGDVNADGVVDLSDSVTILAHLFFAEPQALVPFCFESGSLPDTGQIRCYDRDGHRIDCASEVAVGQDGFYRTGCANAGRFVDNADGTITDNCTGLMWQKDTGNDSAASTWWDSLIYCEELELAGRGDWRLPSVRELHSIVDYAFRGAQPAIDPIFSAVSGNHWSSTSTGRLNDAWAIGFNAGNVFVVRKDEELFLRAVRNDR